MHKLFFALAISISFLFVSCQEEAEICDTVICANGGFCDEQGNCDCPPEFEGSNCENLAPPKAIRINRLTITDFSESNDYAENWDTDDGPDLYVVFSRVDEFISIDETAIIENCAVGNEYEFAVDWSMQGEEYYFYLLDWDNEIVNDIQIIGYDWIGENMFRPMDFRADKPTIIDLPQVSNSGFGMRLEVEWIFE